MRLSTPVERQVANDDSTAILAAMAIDCRDVTVQEARGWAETGHLFAILDACDTPSVVEKVKELGDQRAVSLYRGSAEEYLESIAPYLVVVDTELFDWINGTLWSEPWGVFAISDSSLAALRTHFRKFLLVESPAGEEWYFRYYDPRVLARYLPTCTETELNEFFGSVSTFAVTTAEAGPLMRIARKTASVKTEPSVKIHFRRPPPAA
jgi:Domain of unknown function (DUF4123)